MTQDTTDNDEPETELLPFDIPQTAGIHAAVAIFSLIVAWVISPFGLVQINAMVWFGLSAAILGTGAGLFLTGYTPYNYDALAAFFIIGTGFWLPFYQGFIYLLFVQNIGGIQWLAITLLLSGVFYLYIRNTDESDDAEENSTRTSRRHQSNEGGLSFLQAVGLLALIVIGIAGFVFAGPMVSGWYASEDMAHTVQSNAVEIDAPPESPYNNSRIAPKGVSANWAENSLQYPRYTLDGGDITYIDGKPHWSWSLSPDGTYNSLTQNQIGAVYVDQSSMEKNIIVHDEQTFEYGQGMQFTDNVRWQVAHDEFLNKYGETFVVPHNNESYLVMPYTTHSWEFRLTPVPHAYAMPEFGGVKIIDQDGNIENVPAADTASHPVLDGQNYYPYGLARFKVNSMQFKNGILNTMYGHSEQIELADVPGDGNNQPFTIPTENGPTYMVAVEPWGNANGVYQIWTVDAQDGEMKYTQYSQEDALRGPRKAVDSVMAHPTLSRLNNVKGVEPLPVVRDGTLYWEVRVIPSSSSRVTYVAFFNSDTEEVTVVETTDQVEAFLAGDQTVNIGEDDKNTGDDGEGSEPSGEYAFQVVIEYENGTTETIYIPDGATVQVEQGTVINNSTR